MMIVVVGIGKEPTSVIGRPEAVKNEFPGIISIVAEDSVEIV